MNKILTTTADTPTGPVSLMPTQYDLWTNIYSPAEITRVNALLEEAEHAAALHPMPLKRVKFMREQLWGPVLDGARKFQQSSSDREAWTTYMPLASTPITMDGKLDEPAWQKAPAVYLTPRWNNKGAEVHTRIRLLRDQEYYYVGIEADEPRTGDLLTQKRNFDDTEIWRDNSVEVFLSATPESNFIYQFMLSSSGDMADLRNEAVPAARWNSGFDAHTAVIPGKQWNAEIRIPQASMPELQRRDSIVGNFTRHRALTGEKPEVDIYAWFPWKRNISEFCGPIMLSEPQADGSLILDGDFTSLVHADRFIGPGHWGSGKKILRDTRIFVTTGASLRLEGPEATWARQSLKLEPSTKYRIAFFARTDQLSLPGLRCIVRYGDTKSGATYPLGDYRDCIRETTPWTRFEATFTTPESFGTDYPPFLEFFIGNSTGICHVDHVTLHPDTCRIP